MGEQGSWWSDLAAAAIGPDGARQDDDCAEEAPGGGGRRRGEASAELEEWRRRLEAAVRGGSSTNSSSRTATDPAGSTCGAPAAGHGRSDGPSRRRLEAAQWEHAFKLELCALEHDRVEAQHREQAAELGDASRAAAGGAAAAAGGTAGGAARRAAAAAEERELQRQAAEDRETLAALRGEADELWREVGRVTLVLQEAVTAASRVQQTLDRPALEAPPAQAPAPAAAPAAASGLPGGAVAEAAAARAQLKLDFDGAEGWQFDVAECVRPGCRALAGAAGAGAGVGGGVNGAASPERPLPAGRLGLAEAVARQGAAGAGSLGQCWLHLAAVNSAAAPAPSAGESDALDLSLARRASAPTLGAAGP